MPFRATASSGVKRIVTSFLAALVGCQDPQDPDPQQPHTITVTAVSPVGGPLTGGTNLTITGTNFINVIDVTIGGGAVAGITVVSSTTITGTAPATITSGAQDVVVTSSSHGSGSCLGCFSYYLPITVTGITPAHGPLVGTTVVTITGTNFSNITRVDIGGNALTGLAVVGPTQISGRTPAGSSSGRQNVVVTTSTHGSGTCIACFDYGSTGFIAATAAVGGWHNCALTGSGDAYCWGYGGGGALGNGSFNTISTPIPVSGGLKFSSLVAGFTHTCALTSSGAAYCWGWNGSGQLGDGSLTTSPTPVAVAGGLTFSALTAGADHTCGLTSGGAYCWGANSYGQLGDGSFIQRSTPAPVSGGLTFSALDAGGGHTCGLTGSTTLFCWGDNLSGQLGNGSTTKSASPVPVSGGLSIADFDLGWYHTCGVTVAGSGHCWGDNDNGKLGNGSFTPSVVPVAVSGGLRFSKIATGIYETCGLTASGRIACWGANYLGQLGSGSVGASSPTPVLVTGGLSFTALGVGTSHVCGLTSPGGNFYCWGNNQIGQLGNGIEPIWSPAPVTGLPPASVIGAGGAHACALDVTGVASCWGRNDEAQLGIGVFLVGASPTPLLVAGGRSFRALAAGGLHTCALDVYGPAYCWGNNVSGQLGDGSFGNSAVPVIVSGGRSFSELAAESHEAMTEFYEPYYRGVTCGVNGSGAAFCWGDNLAGQLGVDSLGFRFSTPIAVSGGLSFTTIDLGLDHACAVNSSGAGYCWGVNSFGQLGIGSSIWGSTTPLPVNGGHSFTAIGAGAYHSCGLDVAGAIYCWGNNGYGQLGNGSFTYSQVPVPVSGGLSFSALAVGYWHACGLTVSGAAYCWGPNFFGELGDGTFSASPVPVAVSGGLSFTALTAGEGHTCGLLTSGSAYCWGDNFFGQLGRGSFSYSTIPVPVEPFAVNPVASLEGENPIRARAPSLREPCESWRSRRFLPEVEPALCRSPFQLTRKP